MVYIERSWTNYVSIYIFCAYFRVFLFLPLICSFSGTCPAVLLSSGDPSPDTLTTCQVLCYLRAPSIFFFMWSIRLSIECCPFISYTVPLVRHKLTCELLLNASRMYLLFDFLMFLTFSLQVPNACRFIPSECLCLGLQLWDCEFESLFQQV
jgi:hypothetical protein